MSWTKSLPTPGESENTWGGMLNDAIGEIRTFVENIPTNLASGLAAKFDKTGGALTGRITTKSVDTGLVALAGNAPTIDLSLGNYFAATISGPTNFQPFTNKPAAASGFVLYLTNGGAPGAAVNFAETIHWPGGATPPFTAAGVDVLVFLTRDAGATWQATVAMQDVRAVV